MLSLLGYDHEVFLLLDDRWALVLRRTLVRLLGLFFSRDRPPYIWDFGPLRFYEVVRTGCRIWPGPCESSLAVLWAPGEKLSRDRGNGAARPTLGLT